MPNVIVKLRYYAEKSNNTKIHSRRAFYSSKQADDYLGYMDKGSKAKGYVNYLDYAGNNEKSAGVFDKNGLLSKEQKKDLRQKLRNTKSCIWDLVISFEKQYGKTQLQDLDDAKNLLNARLNRFLKQAGLNPENVLWYAALHENTNNRHIHVSFFENEPQHYRQKDRINKYFHSGNISRHAFDSFKLSVEQYFSATTTKVKESRKQLLYETAKVIQKVPYERKLSRMFVELAERIPTEGHVGYLSDNMRVVRSRVDEITTCMLRDNPRLKSEYAALKQALQKHDYEICEAARIQKIQNYDDYLITNKTVSDIYRRIGNKVIRQALLLKKQKCEEMKSKRRKRYEMKELGYLIEETARLNAACEQEAIDCFQEFLRKLDEARYENSEEEYEM